MASLLLGLSESYLADLGRVVAAWSHVEHHFDILFISFVVMRGRSSGSTREPAFKKVGEGFDRRIRMFRERLDELELPADLRFQASKTLDRLMTLRDERDVAAHCVWYAQLEDSDSGGLRFRPDKATSIFKSWRNSKEHEWKTVPQTRLKEIFQKIDALWRDLLMLSLDERLRSQTPRQPSA